MINDSLEEISIPCHFEMIKKTVLNQVMAILRKCIAVSIRNDVQILEIVWYDDTNAMME